jgi:hypothetical protein
LFQQESSKSLFLPQAQQQHNLEFLIDIWKFLKERKKFFLAPVIIVLLIVGALIVIGGGSTIAPFIYSLF